MKYFCLVVCILFCQLIKAQDLIIKSNNDSIQCQIIKFEKNDSTSYVIFKGGIKVFYSIASNDVKKIIRDFYTEIAQNNLDSIYIIQAKRNYFNKARDNGYFTEKKVRFSFDYFLILDKMNVNVITPKVKNQDLIGDFSFQFDVSLNKSNNIYLGLKYSKYNYEVKYENENWFSLIVVDNNAGKLLKSFVNCNSVGFNSLFKYPSKNGYNNFYLVIGINKFFYSEDYYFENNFMAFKGETYGIYSGFNYDYRIYKKLGIGCGLLINFGTVNEFEFNNNGKISKIVSENVGVNLRTINASAGLKYYIGK